LTRQCSGITGKGTRCTRHAEGSNGLCWLHDPTRAEDRRRAASKAGKSKPNRELLDIKSRLVQLSEDVLEGAVKRADAAVAGQLLNYVTRVVSVEIKVRETEEMEARLEELEAIIAHQQNQRRSQTW
jgi:hypothetical protein